MLNRNLVKFVLRIIIFLFFIYASPSLTSGTFEMGNNMKKESSKEVDRSPEVFKLTPSGENWVESKLARMTLREKCAQMIMPWVQGDYSSEDSKEYQRIKNLVENDKVGGLIFFQGNVTDEAVVINKMQKLAKTPLLVASDFERGLAMRLKGALEFPYNMALAATGDSLFAFKMGRDVAIECKAIGVNQNYSPVADINNNPENPIINIRSFSENRDVVSDFCSEFIKGASSVKVITTAKHFPGHGDTQIDSHKDLPIIRLNKKELDKNELVPFEKSISSGVQSIMVGHLEVPAFDSTEGLPASLSKPIVTGLLKRKLGFNGLVVTDAMNMSAITKYYSVGESTVMAAKAGNDLILMPADDEIAINSLVDAVDSGEISIQRINDSVRKILSAKRWLGLNNKRFTDINKIAKIVGKKSHLRLSEEIAKKSITLVKNERKIIPIDTLKYSSAACIIITDTDLKLEDFLFPKLIDSKVQHLKTIVINKNSKRSDYYKAYRIARHSKMILLPTYISFKAYKGTVELSKENEQFIHKLLRLRAPSVVISFDNPYLLSMFPKAKTYLCSYGAPPVSQQAMAEAILGEIDIQGKLPISIPNTDYSIGHGIYLKRTSLFFNGPGCDSSYNFSNINRLIKKGIKNNLFPGVNLLIGKNGEIIYNKQFGNYSFDSTSPKMRNDAIFNLGSYSNILSIESAIMLLNNKGKLKLKDKVDKYITGFGINGKDNITIRNLLLQNSGLPPYSSLPRIYKDSTAELNAIIRSKPISPAGDNVVYSKLNWILLSNIVEKISGENIDAYLSKNLFKPLGMNRTGFKIDKELQYYYSTQISESMNDETDSIKKESIFSDPRDLAIYLQMLLQNGNYGGKSIFKLSTLKNWDNLSDLRTTLFMSFDKTLQDNSSEEFFSNVENDNYSSDNKMIWLDRTHNMFVIFLASGKPNKSYKMMEFKNSLTHQIYKALND